MAGSCLFLYFLFNVSSPYTIIGKFTIAFQLFFLPAVLRKVKTWNGARSFSNLSLTGVQVLLSLCFHQLAPYRIPSVLKCFRPSERRDRCLLILCGKILKFIAYLIMHSVTSPKSLFSKKKPSSRLIVFYQRPRYWTIPQNINNGRLV